MPYVGLDSTFQDPELVLEIRLQLTSIELTRGSGGVIDNDLKWWQIWNEKIWKAQKSWRPIISCSQGRRPFFAVSCVSEFWIKNIILNLNDLKWMKIVLLIFWINQLSNIMSWNDSVMITGSDNSQFKFPWALYVTDCDSMSLWVYESMSMNLNMKKLFGFGMVKKDDASQYILPSFS